MFHHSRAEDRGGDYASDYFLNVNALIIPRRELAETARRSMFVRV